MKTAQLPGTGVESTRLGFGCGRLMRVRSRAARRRLLDEAFDAGIRHFDVARMYGLGAAERELGRFARGRRDRLVIATKCGIAPSPLGRALRRVQGLIRPLLPLIPAVRALARSRAEGLYQPRSYDAASARASLETSLRELGTDYVDLFLLHEPALEDLRRSDLRSFLESAKREGKLRAWGVAGPATPALEIRRRLPEMAPVVQIPNDAVRRQIEGVAADQAVVTFSPLSHALPAIQEHLSSRAGATRRWSDAIDCDLDAVDTLANLLLGYCLRANPGGVILFSTTRRQRLRSAARCVDGDSRIPDPALDAFLELVAREVRMDAP